MRRKHMPVDLCAMAATDPVWRNIERSLTKGFSYHGKICQA